MSNINLIIEERTTQMGSIRVGRLLPFREKRMVGPFIFIDHMGPVVFSERDQFDVLPHPHIGLSTLTFLFEGSIMHRDSIGNQLEIMPGEVNWMTAGKGVVHSERTPDHLRQSEKKLHGLQIWVALPKHLEQMEPSFTHLRKEEIPAWTDKGCHWKLIAGKVLGKRSPVPVYSPLYMIEIKATQRQTLNIGDDLFGESGLYIMEGAVHMEGHRFTNKQILVANNTRLCRFDIEENTTIYIFGGDPFPEERYIDWNFVSSDKQLIEQAKIDWEQQRFPKVKGDETAFVPYPVKPAIRQ